MLIAQVSDTHIRPPGELLYGRIDSAARLRRVVERIRGLDTQPDCLLLSGDLTDGGEPQAYRHLQEILAPLDVPICAIPGNHDRREALRAAFAQCPWMPAATARIDYVVELAGLRILALDTLIEGAEHGALADHQLAWLDTQLARAPGTPAVVMLHHPPVNCGLRAMDALKLARPERLGAIVARHPQIERIVCGHLHRTLHVRWQGTTVSVAPSTAEQTEASFLPQAALGDIAEPPGFQLHYWHPCDRLITYTLAVLE